MNTPRRWDLLAFGDPCADIVVGVDQAPQFGDKLLGRPLGVFSGGTTANAACAMARLGGRAALYGRVGGDAHATLLRESLHAFGVDTEHLRSEPDRPSASVIALVPPSGERAIVYMPMAPTPLQEHDLEVAMRQAQLFYAMPYDLDEFAAAARVARRCGTLVAIDIEPAVAPDAQALHARLAHADIVFFNEAGFRAGTGEEPHARALAAVLQRGPLAVVVTQGAGGAVAGEGGCLARSPAWASEVVDTTGAGDTFNAAYLFAMLQGRTLAERLHFACAAASRTVAAVGARSGMPDRASVERLLQHPLAQD